VQSEGTATSTFLSGPDFGLVQLIRGPYFHRLIASGLQIDDHVTVRLRATHQQIAFGGPLQRLGLIPYSAADQTGLAHVADTSSARPLHTNIASFREIQQASKRRVPWHRETTSRKRDLRAQARCSGGNMGERPGSRFDAWCNRGARAKQFGVNFRFGSPSFLNTCGEAAQEGRWAAEIEVRVLRNTKLIEQSHAQPSCRVIIATESVTGAGLAVRNMAPAMRERFQNIPRFLGKGMIASVTRAIYPPDLAGG
jgi:hypothetical protein